MVIVRVVVLQHRGPSGTTSIAGVGEGTVDRTYGVNSVCSTGASVCVVLEDPESAIEGLTGGKCVLTTSTTLLSVVTADDYRALFVWWRDVA